MRTFTIALITIFPLAVSADPKPTTQACLGTFDQFLTCPAGTQRAGTECRAKSGHWSGSSRQGPALFLRSDRKTVSFAASYKDHKKTGRVYRFDDQGRLESWTDMVDDQDHGLSVTCLPDGRVWYLAYYDHGKVSGISRSWRASDGAFVAAMGHDAAGHAQRVDVSAQEQVRPDALCRPARCDVHAKPDTSGLGK
jgi:hypothetical protein